MDELLSYQTGLQMSEQQPDTTAIVRALEAKRDEAVMDRAEVEARWIRDLQQYEGNTLDRMSKGDTTNRNATRNAPPVVHLTRSRTLAIAAKIINMLVPSNERSWDIEPTPVPSMSQNADDDTPVMDPATGQMAMMPDDQAPEDAPQPVSGDPSMMDQGMMQGQAPGMQGQPQDMQQPPMRPVTRADLVKMEMEDAEKRCNRMKQHMDDQTKEGRYNTEQRTLVLDGCKIGTGVLEGPVVSGAFKKNRQQLPDGQWLTQMAEVASPQFKAIDPWNFYPLPAERIEDCEGVFIDMPMTRRKLQELKTLPGFDAEMIDEILREEPNHSDKYISSLAQRANLSGETQNLTNRYSVWKYTGSLNRKDMDALGVDVDEELDLVDPCIEAWFVNTRLLKIKRHALEGVYRLPYYVWNYERSDTSIFGYGVPYFMRDSDRVIQSTWHMILHNAAINAGSNVVRKKGVVEPADGSEEITGGLKQWYLADVESTVEEAFRVFNFECRIDELSAVHDRARQNADEELGFPLIAQGEPTEAVPTASGLAMLMNAANVVQRRIAQSYDDDVIEPSISALYEYNMTYLDDDDAKGDMKVNPLGATKLVVKDMQAQNLMLIANMTTNDRFAPLMKDDELLRMILKAAEVDPDSLMKSEEELGQQGPSETEIAELEKIKAETEKLRAEAAQMGAPEGGGDEAVRMAEIELGYEKLRTSIVVQEMQIEEAYVNAARAENIKLAEIDARLQANTRSEQTKVMLAQIEDRRKTVVEGYNARLKAREVAMKELNLRKGFDTYG